MSLDLPTLLFLGAFAVLVVLGVAWNGSRSQQRNLFAAKVIEPAGEFAGLAIFRLHCGNDGPKVGIHFAAADDDLRVALDPAEAVRLARLLEKAAGGATGS